VDFRNKREYRGGALMDIGCYRITTPRFMFGEEPARVLDSWSGILRKRSTG
jgi:predicted dehydrogenase